MIARIYLEMVESLAQYQCSSSGDTSSLAAKSIGGWGAHDVIRYSIKTSLIRMITAGT